MKFLLFSLLYLFAATKNANLSAQSLFAGQNQIPSTTIPLPSVKNWDSPKNVLELFMTYAQNQRFENAALYLDLRGSIALRVDCAKKLYELINKKGWLNLPSNADDEQLETAPNHNHLIVGEIRVNSTREDIVLKRFESGGKVTWKFSGDFLKKIPRLYEEIGDSRLKQFFPQWVREQEVLDVSLWQWFSGFLLLLTAMLLGSVFCSSFYYLLKRATISSLFRFDLLIEDIYTPFKYLVALGLFHLASFFLELSLNARTFMTGIENFLIILLLTLISLKFCSFLIEHLKTSLKRNQHNNALAMLPSAHRVLKVFIILIGISFILKDLGVNITAIVAGLGVGGIAIALAGQKSLENLFGGVSVLIDQPVRVGDLCRFGQSEIGTIEDIGLRSTRIRMLNRTVVTIPNAEFSQIQLENFDRRDKIRFYQILPVKHDTLSSTLRIFLEQIRSLLRSHPKIEAEQSRAHFLRYGSYGIEIEIIGFVLTKKYAEYLVVAEEINLEILDIMAEIKVEFALPSSRIFLPKGTEPIAEHLMSNPAMQSQQFSAP